MELMTTLQQPMRNDECHTGIHSQKPEDKRSLSSGFYYLRRALSGCAVRMLDIVSEIIFRTAFFTPHPRVCGLLPPVASLGGA